MTVHLVLMAIINLGSIVLIILAIKNDSDRTNAGTALFAEMFNIASISLVLLTGIAYTFS